MAIKSRKVAIVGTGLVGSSAGFSLVTQGVCEEIIMIDINHEKALGEAMDLSHCIEYLDQHTKVRAGSYEDCADVDAIIITAGPPPKPGQSRLDTLEASARIMKSIVEPIMKSGFNGHFIIISNPVDIMAYYVWKLSGLPKSHVIGTGTSVDSARLKHFIADLVQVDPRSVQAYSMGEHGDSQMVPWSHVYIGGKPFSKVIKDNKDRIGNVDLDKLTLDTAQAGWAVFNRKGTTYYGIATAAVGIIKAIFNDENKIIPVSTLLEGEYGFDNVFAGVPAVLNKDGVKELVEIEMAEEEKVKFNKSVETIKKHCSLLSI
ncbi:L-lactate dehydrogenase [Clostridium sp. YIM B02551]|uniref:L-lactate dehydrogenase n=1 Tax=Clostridium sp. YIM B02551 TaxID=2910679 RepID=UPI001EEA857D|nr:L-lactate dehydrogenase [Clostridium sp. YIM B02551]